MAKIETPVNFYTARKVKLLKQFDRVFKRVRKSLIKVHGEDFAEKVVQDSRKVFESLLPQLPYVGGRDNPGTMIIIINGWVISFFKVMRLHGKSAEDIVQTCCEVTDSYFRPVPGFVWHFIGRLSFGRLFLRRVKRYAAKSQDRRYTEDWVFQVVEGESENCDWGFEFTECAVQKLYDAHGLNEMKPYCNLVDLTYSRYMNMGLDASSTIGLGFEKCRLLYKRGRETNIPAPLQGLLPIQRGKL